MIFPHENCCFYLVFPRNFGRNRHRSFRGKTIIFKSFRLATHRSHPHRFATCTTAIAFNSTRTVRALAPIHFALFASTLVESPSNGNSSTSTVDLPLSFFFFSPNTSIQKWFRPIWYIPRFNLIYSLNNLRSCVLLHSSRSRRCFCRRPNKFFVQQHVCV